VKIVYMTGRMHDKLASLFANDALQVLERYGAAVELHCWGYHPPELKGHRGVRLVRPVRDYDRHLRRFSRRGYDIGLAPLLDDEFHRAKTDTKFREYGACRVAGVYSNVEVYADAVTDGETGLLASNEPGAWSAAMARLIDDRRLRERIQANAWEHVRQHYSPEAFSAGWWEHIRGLPAVAPAARHHADDSPPATNAGRAPAVRITRQGWSLIERARRRGPASAWHTFGWYWNNLWALLRVRWDTSRQPVPEPPGPGEQAAPPPRG